MARKAVKSASRAFNFAAKKVGEKCHKNDCLSRIRRVLQLALSTSLVSLARNKRETRVFVSLW